MAEADGSTERDFSSSPAVANSRRARTIAQSLLDIGAVKLQPSDPFTWTSGLVSPIYCDNRRTIAYPSVRRAIRDGFKELVEEASYPAVTVAGTATAGIPHAAWLAEALDQPMAYVRDSAKNHGARIEGDLKTGEDVVVVEDLISTGGSALDAVASLRDAGATVQAVLAIFTYQLSAAAQAFRDANVECKILTDFETLIDVAHSESRLSDEELRALEEWRDDPGAWSIARGGIDPEA